MLEAFAAKRRPAVAGRRLAVEATGSEGDRPWRKGAGREGDRPWRKGDRVSGGGAQQREGTCQREGLVLASGVQAQTFLASRSGEV